MNAVMTRWEVPSFLNTAIPSLTTISGNDDNDDDDNDGDDNGIYKDKNEEKERRNESLRDAQTDLNSRW